MVDGGRACPPQASRGKGKTPAEADEPRAGRDSAAFNEPATFKESATPTGRSHARDGQWGSAPHGSARTASSSDWPYIACASQATSASICSPPYGGRDCCKTKDASRSAGQGAAREHHQGSDVPAPAEDSASGVEADFAPAAGTKRTHGYFLGCSFFDGNPSGLRAARRTTAIIRTTASAPAAISGTWIR